MRAKVNIIYHINFTTACQHQRHIIEHKARENGIPAQRMYIPHCRNDNGGFEPIQCHPLTRMCWCVSEAGEEIPGTRSQPGMRPNCQSELFKQLISYSKDDHVTL